MLRYGFRIAYIYLDLASVAAVLMGLNIWFSNQIYVPRLCLSGSGLKL